MTRTLYRDSFHGLMKSVTEKQVETSGDRLMESLGFTAIRFSQPRNTMQTRGIPDRRYYKAGERAVWWEAKRPHGSKHSVYQKAFQELVESCGEDYVVGELDRLEDWCIAQGLIRRTSHGNLVALRAGMSG
jgi:hypothetical protein